MARAGSVYFSGLTPEEEELARKQDKPLTCYFCKREYGTKSVRLFVNGPKVVQKAFDLKVGEYALSAKGVTVRFHICEECDAIISMIRKEKPDLQISLPESKN